MKIEVATQFGGGMQFIVKAENEQDEVLLALFAQQTGKEDFCLHGFTQQTGPRVTDFNFGTRKDRSK